MICPKCKKNIKPSSKFCGYCGNKFTVKSTPMITEPVPKTIPKPVSTPSTSLHRTAPIVSSSSSTPTAKCPRCGSTSLQAEKKG